MASEPDSQAAPNRVLPWVLAVALTAAPAWIHAGAITDLERREDQSLSLVAQVHRAIADRAVQDQDASSLAYDAARAMTEKLDPYSRFFTPEEAAALREDTRGEFGGLGVVININEDGLVSVVAPLEGTPAWEAGLLPGDIFLSIDGQKYKFKETTDATKMLKGPPGSEVRVEVQHKGAQDSKEVAIKRAIIKLDSVRDARMLDGQRKIGYLRLLAFQSDTFEELATAVLDLVKAEAEALIIDLRSNPGGLLRTATDIADLFLELGKPIVTTKGRDHEPDTISSEVEPPFAEIPVAILIDEGSASASEILGGALRDNGRAVLVGARSYGKGSVQSVIELVDNESILKLTTAYYYTPSGRRIHRPDKAKDEDEWGLLPDIAIPLSLEQRTRLAREQYEAYISQLKSRADENNGAAPAAEKAVLDPSLEQARRHLSRVLAGKAPLIPAKPQIVELPKKEPETKKEAEKDAGSRD